MPQQQTGGLTVVLCTGFETVTLTLDENGKPIETVHQLCDWSGMASVVDLPTEIPGATPAEFDTFNPDTEPLLAVLVADHNDQNRPRGPPIFL